MSDFRDTSGLVPESSKLPGPNDSTHDYRPPNPNAGESNAERYARQTRNATVFIAIVIGLGLVISLVLGILAVVSLHDLTEPVSTIGGGL